MSQDVRPDETANMESELEFLAAMRAFRAARESGDSEAIAEAEEAWRSLVRGELQGK